MITGTNYAPLKTTRVFGGNGNTSGPPSILPPPPGLSRKRHLDEGIAGPQSKRTSFAVSMPGSSTPGGRGSMRGGRGDGGDSRGGFVDRGNA
jgi:hypothetical protein